MCRGMQKRTHSVSFIKIALNFGGNTTSIALNLSWYNLASSTMKYFLEIVAYMMFINRHQLE